MKHSENRKKRKKAIRTHLASKSSLKKDGSLVMQGLSAALALVISMSVSADAVNLPESEISVGAQETIAEVAAQLPLNTSSIRLSDKEQMESRPVNLKMNRMYDGSLALETTTTSTASETSTSSTTTTTTTSSTTTEATTSFAEETRQTTVETEAEPVESESEFVEPTTWEDDSEEASSMDDANVYDYVSEDEIIMLAKTVAQEGGDCSYAQQACVVWTVLNRVDSWEWPNTIAENLTMPGQFAYYSNKSYRDDHYQVAYDQVCNWLFGGERYLGSDYQYFYGDGWRNHFYGKNSDEYVPD